MPKFIKGWEDSEKYKLDIDLKCGSGWIVPKVETEETDNEYYSHHVYLSTHTFYGSNYKASTKLLQKYGFNVELANWDRSED